VTAWDELAAAASPILVHARREGLFVVDGHQRVGLARRLGVPTLAAVRLAGSVTIADARRRGARLNLQNGSGTALDVAKLLRAEPLDDGERAKLPTDALAGEVIRTAEALARLGDAAFLRVVNGQVHPVPQKNARYAAIVGRLVTGEAEQ